MEPWKVVFCRFRDVLYQLDRSKEIFSVNGFKAWKARCWKNVALKWKLAQTIMKFVISMLDYPRSTESQLKSEGTLAGLSSWVWISTDSNKVRDSFQPICSLTLFFVKLTVSRDLNGDDHAQSEYVIFIHRTPLLRADMFHLCETSTSWWT